MKARTRAAWKLARLDQRSGSYMRVMKRAIRGGALRGQYWSYYVGLSGSAFIGRNHHEPVHEAKRSGVAPVPYRSPRREYNHLGCVTSGDDPCPMRSAARPSWAIGAGLVRCGDGYAKRGHKRGAA